MTNLGKEKATDDGLLRSSWHPLPELYRRHRLVFLNHGVLADPGQAFDDDCKVAVDLAGSIHRHDNGRLMPIFDHQAHEIRFAIGDDFGGGELKRQEQIVRMVCHLLKAVAFVELDCGLLRIDHQADTANLVRNARHPVDGVEEHVLPNTLPLMPFGRCQSPQPEHGKLGRQALPILCREVSVHQLSQTDSVETKHFRTGLTGYRHKGRGNPFLFVLPGCLTQPIIQFDIATVETLPVMPVV
jgi:hypothetical protein